MSSSAGRDSSRQPATADATSTPRYPGGDTDDLRSISDPAAPEDETRTSVREWAGQNKSLAAGLFIIAPLGIGVLLLVANRIVVGLLTNPLFIGGVLFVGYTGVIVIASRRQQRGVIDDLDELVVAGGQRARVYKGRFERSAGGDPVFVPIKGYNRLGTPGDEYTIAELSPSLAQKYEAMNRYPGSEARILLEPAFLYPGESAYGTRLVQLSGGLVINGFSTDGPPLRASRPDVADEDALESATSLIDNLRDELDQQEAKLDQLRRQKDDAEDEAKKRRREIIKEFLAQNRALMEAASSRHPRTRGTTPAAPQTPRPSNLTDGNGSRDLDSVVDEYLPDEED
jgi:hypothetical protein